MVIFLAWELHEPIKFADLSLKCLFIYQQQQKETLMGYLIQTLVYENVNVYYVNVLLYMKDN